MIAGLLKNQDNSRISIYQENNYFRNSQQQKKGSTVCLIRFIQINKKNLILMKNRLTSLNYNKKNPKYNNNKNKFQDLKLNLHCFLKMLRSSMKKMKKIKTKNLDKENYNNYCLINTLREKKMKKNLQMIYSKQTIVSNKKKMKVIINTIDSQLAKRLISILSNHNCNNIRLLS